MAAFFHENDDADDDDLDVNLYSRQILVYGKGAQRRLERSSPVKLL